jgi:hypothetical protein
MFTNNMSKTFVVLVVIAVALVTASFVTRSATIPAADRSYDHLEQLRALHSAASSYDLIEHVRIQRSANVVPAASGYDLIEQVRMARTSNANGSYDQIENLRLSR